MKVAGFWTGNDSSYALLDSLGRPIVHNEIERFNRVKMSVGDPFGLYVGNHPELRDQQIIDLTSKLNALGRDNQ